MKKWLADHILKMASFFEKKAISIFDYRLRGAISDLLNISITEDTFNEWREINNNQLIPILGEDLYFYDFGRNITRSYLDIPSSTKDTFVFISKTPQPDAIVNSYDVKISSILKGTTNIPTLYLYIAESAGSGSTYSISVVPDLDLAHYYFIAQALQKLLNVNFNNPDSLDETKQFIKENKEIIDKIKRSFKSVPQILGSGADGVAFSVGPDLVLKIFLDDVSYNAAKDAMKRLHKYPDLARTEAMIYDVGVLGEFRGDTLYFYLIERMKPVRSIAHMDTNLLYNISDLVKDYIASTKASIWRPAKRLLHEPDKYAFIRQRVSAASKVLAKRLVSKYGYEIKKFKEDNDLRPDWLEALCEEIIMKYLTSRTDLHIGNMGVTEQGYLRYFDPAYGDWQSEIN